MNTTTKLSKEALETKIKRLEAKRLEILGRPNNAPKHFLETSQYPIGEYDALERWVAHLNQVKHLGEEEEELYNKASKELKNLEEELHSVNKERSECERELAINYTLPKYVEERQEELEVALKETLERQVTLEKELRDLTNKGIVDLRYERIDLSGITSTYTTPNATSKLHSDLNASSTKGIVDLNVLK